MPAIVIGPGDLGSCLLIPHREREIPCPCKYQSRRIIEQLRGTVIHDDLQCTKLLDKSSPKIAEAVSLGKVFSKVEIHVKTNINSGRETYYKYELKDVMVTGYNVSGGSQDKPHESFSLNFEEIKVTYTEMDEKGSKKGDVAYGWKVEQGTKA